MDSMEGNRDLRFVPVDLTRVFNADARILPREFEREVAGVAGGLTARLADYAGTVPSGSLTFRGIPFLLGGREPGSSNVLYLSEYSIEVPLGQEEPGLSHIVFAHSSCMDDPPIQDDGLWARTRDGVPTLREVVSRYSLLYEDGTSFVQEIRRGRQINEFHALYGITTTEAVPHFSDQAVPTASESIARMERPAESWGFTQTRISMPASGRYIIWLYALENPFRERRIRSLRLDPTPAQRVIVCGITACRLSSHPLRWDSRARILLTVPAGVALVGAGDTRTVEVDMGEIIAIIPAIPPDGDQAERRAAEVPASSRYIVEYTSHPDAIISIRTGKIEERVPVRDLGSREGSVSAVLPPCSKPVRMRVVDGGGTPVPVRVHVHDSSGQYIAPTERSRYPNRFWFEDYGADHVSAGRACTYINGVADYRLPLGEVFVEVSKGFEVTPVRKHFKIEGRTEELVIELQRVLHWRETGWVSADTHVHFLSPPTALLEGEAEGVNVVNLLASQWGEMFTNVGDFDGKTTFGERGEGAHATGEYMVRVGTENRQHVLGHISLLGYEGRMILPLATSGPVESALGDPLEESMTSWARRCRTSPVRAPRTPR
jgi:hypothetical protein